MVGARASQPCRRLLVDGRIDEATILDGGERAHSWKRREARSGSSGYASPLCGEWRGDVCCEDGPAEAAIRVRAAAADPDVARTYSVDVFCGHAADGLRVRG